MLGIALSGAFAAEPGPSPTAEPFLRLRDANLGYHGTSDDLVDLQEIRLGWFGPSDPADPVHGDFWWAAHLAVEEINQRPPAADRSAFGSLPVRLIPRWAPDPWRAGVSLLARMVFDEHPLALLGSVDSASTHLAEQVVAKVNLPLVSPVATDKTATLAGVSWMFACAPDDTAIARTLADDLPQLAPRSSNEINSQLSTLKSPLSLVLLSTTDHASRMTAREVMRELSRRGVSPEFRFEVAPGAAHLSTLLQAMADAHPAAVIVIAEADDAATITRAVRAQFGAATVYGGPTLGLTRFRQLAGPAAEGVRFPLLFAPDPADPAAAAFVSRFTAARHHAPDYAAALAYDATRLLIAAIHRAGPNRARIREALVQLSPWSGIAGEIAFDGTGQNRRANLRLGTVRDGVVIAVDPASPTTPNPTSLPSP